MSDIGATMKSVFSTSAKFVVKVAKSAVKSSKYKLNELSAMSKRRDLISELGAKVYELSKAGHELPVETSDLITQIANVEYTLETMRAEHAAQKAEAAAQHAAEKAARASEKAAAQDCATVQHESVSDDIDVVEPMPSAETTATVDEESVTPTLNIQEEETDCKPQTDIPTLNV